MPTNPTPTGLTTRQAKDRLRDEGANELPSAKPRRLWNIAWDVVKEPMLLLLIACGSVYLLLGDVRDALVLLGFVFMIMGITFYQEHKTERSLEALRDLSSPRALVVRDGVQVRIAGSEVVRGDVLVLAEGGRVPADAALISCLNMTVDESLLTGESMHVSKEPTDNIPDKMGVAGGDGLPFVFSGSLIVQGTGVAQVIAIGSNTALGQIGKALSSVQQEPTRVQTEMQRVVKIVAIASIVCALILAVWFGATRGEWLNGLLVGITFAMALIPEELPVVLTLFLGIGAWRIAQKRVLTRRIPAIELLGATTVLCVDKTGTLTQNKMAVAQLFAHGQTSGCINNADLAEDFHEVLEFAILASHREPFDPMEIAIQEAGKTMLAGTDHLHASWTLVEEYALSKELLAMSRVWQSADQSQYIIAAKGAPEAIADLCHCPSEQIDQITAQVNAMAGKGLRVLGVARASFAPANNPDALPEIQHDFPFEFLGLIALADPVRDGVPAAIKECQTAGIRIVMITGDYPATALSIAAQCGIDVSGGAITGAELSELDEAQLLAKLRNKSNRANIFCRVVPEQKLRLVNAFKSTGEIVAMTGDGVNDAPALKAAHIGIAMGKRGTDVARESAALVLLDDDFGSIVAAIKLGRRIFDNLRKTICFIVAVHMPIIGMSMLPVLLGWPLMLMPIHILVLQLIIDPTCSLVFEAEAEEPDVMQRPPRKTDASIFDRRIVLAGAMQGVALLAVLIGIFAFALQRGIAPESARALAFSAMVIGNVGLIFANRSLSGAVWRRLFLPNAALGWVTAVAALMLGAALSVPALRGLFYFGVVEWRDLGLSTLAALMCVGGILVVKALAASKSPSPTKLRQNHESTK
jgi:P-type Ca2+ transporter type 2C